MRAASAKSCKGAGGKCPPGVKNGSVRARAARPFYPQEQTSSACPQHVRLVPLNEPASAGGAGGDRRAYGSENLSPMPQKDFCNTIEGITDIETLVA
jgi:hypothetical protein